ncbi:hypothetical protein TNCV_246921 [Trichonephila clavipes]|nr:hypothetical protein TNCV_246921 [Trichonephila clavipes]
MVTLLHMCVLIVPPDRRCQKEASEMNRGKGARIHLPSYRSLVHLADDNPFCLHSTPSSREKTPGVFHLSSRATNPELPETYAAK